MTRLRVPKGQLKVAQDVSPGLDISELNSPVRGRLNAEAQDFSRPLRDWVPAFGLPRTGVLGYFQPSLRDSRQSFSKDGG